MATRPTDRRLREAFRAAFENGGISQEELAKRLNARRGSPPEVAQSTISKWKSGKATPEDLDEVASALGVRIDVSYGDEKAAAPQWERRLEKVLEDEFRRLRADLLDRVATKLADAAVEQEFGPQPSGEAEGESQPAPPGSEALRIEPEP